MTTSTLPLLLALLTAVAVAGALLGIRMIRADAKLPSDLALALEVGATRVSRTGSAVDRLGMRFAPLVLRLMGPRRVEAKRHRIDMAGNPGGLTLNRYAARRAVYGFFGAFMGLVFLTSGRPSSPPSPSPSVSSPPTRRSGRPSANARTSSTAPCPTSSTSSRSWSR